MKEPCEHCPFRKDVKPFLTPARGIELAMLTRNPKGVFNCHETLDYSKFEGRVTADTRLCIGFATLRAQESSNRFVKPHETVYGTMGEMMLAYIKGAIE